MCQYVQKGKKAPKNGQKWLIFALIYPIISVLPLICNFIVQFLSNLIKSNAPIPKLRIFEILDFSIWWYTCNSVLLRVVVSSSPYENQNGCFNGYHGNQKNRYEISIAISYQQTPIVVSRNHI